MARGTKGRIRVIIECEEYDDTGAGMGNVPKRLAHPLEYEWAWESGTTDGTQMDRVYSADPTLTTTPTDVDLVSASSLASAMDASLNVAFTGDVCVICAVNDGTAGGGNVNIGGSGSNDYAGHVLAAGDGNKVGPRGIFLWCNPYGGAPTASTADILRVVASTGSVPSRLFIAGRSA